MKKTKLYTMIAVLVLASACSAKEKTYKCELDSPNLQINVKYEYIVKGDDVESIKIIQKADLALVGMDEESYFKTVDAYKAKFDVAGLEYDVNVKDGISTEETKVDLKNADINDLIKLKLIDSKNKKKVSFEKEKTKLELAGAKCS